jgi:hypothetical protein
VSSAESAAYLAARPVPAETEVAAASSEARACVVAREAKAVWSTARPFGVPSGCAKAEGQTHEPAKAVGLCRAVGGAGKLNDQRVKDALAPGMQMHFPASPAVTVSSGSRAPATTERHACPAEQEEWGSGAPLQYFVLSYFVLS